MKRVTVGTFIVHSSFAAAPPKAPDIRQTVAQLLAVVGSLPWNRAKARI
jgi:hypothetical protein